MSKDQLHQIRPRDWELQHLEEHRRHYKLEQAFRDQQVEDFPLALVDPLQALGWADHHHLEEGHQAAHRSASHRKEVSQEEHRHQDSGAEEDPRPEDHRQDLEGRHLVSEDRRVDRLVGCRQDFRVDHRDRAEDFHRQALVVVK